jgi:hypothetical protein
MDSHRRVTGKQTGVRQQTVMYAPANGRARGVKQTDFPPKEERAPSLPRGGAGSGKAVESFA